MHNFINCDDIKILFYICIAPPYAQYISMVLTHTHPMCWAIFSHNVGTMYSVHLQIQSVRDIQSAGDESF